MTKIEKLERAAVLNLLKRTRQWMKDNPNGLLPRKSPYAIQDPLIREFVTTSLRFCKAVDADPKAKRSYR